MANTKQLKELRCLTNAGLADCRRALDQAGGDLFAATISMLTEEDVLQLRQSVRVRAAAGQSIKNPVDDDEQALIAALASYFVAQRTRPLNVGLLFEVTALFYSDSVFRAAIMDDPDAAIQEVWQLLDADGDTQDLPTAETVESRECLSTVVTMPVPQSEWECDFIVLQHPRRKLLRSTSPKVFAVYKRTKRDDCGVVNIEEMAARGNEVTSTRRWVLKDAILQPAELARVGFAAGLLEVTQ